MRVEIDIALKSTTFKSKNHNYLKGIEMGKDIIFTETDINSLVMSKDAVYAGFTVLLNQAGLDFSM